MKRPKRKPEDNDPEVARLILHLKSLPYWAVFALSTDALLTHLKLDLNKTTVYVAVKKFRKSLEGKMAGKQKGETTGDALPVEEVGAQLVLERIARIVTKTYAHAGDAEEVSSEDANLMTLRELKSYDPSLIARNEKRALPKHAPVPNN